MLPRKPRNVLLRLQDVLLCVLLRLQDEPPRLQDTLLWLQDVLLRKPRNAGRGFIVLAR
jgi:hypothetical protein